MRTIIFVILIIASASYLALGDKSPLSVSGDGKTVSLDVDKVQSDLSAQLQNKFAALKDEMTKNQQRQIEALQQSVVNLAQKNAKLERKVAQLEVNFADKASLPVMEQTITGDLDGPDVGAIKKPRDYDNLDDSQTDVVVQVDQTTQPQLDTVMMNKQQRRKRLQSLSERMELRSLGVEK